MFHTTALGFFCQPVVKLGAACVGCCQHTDICDIGQSDQRDRRIALWRDIPQSNNFTNTRYIRKHCVLLFSALSRKSSDVTCIALRAKVPALLNGQVAVTAQRLERISPENVSAPRLISSRLAASGYTVVVTFTTTPTESVVVTRVDVDAAAMASAAAFIDIATLDVAKDAIVSGECAYRCGLGCALCFEGEACVVDGDCKDGNCKVSGVCGPPSKNAASVTSLS